MLEHFVDITNHVLQLQLDALALDAAGKGEDLLDHVRPMCRAGFHGFEKR